MKFIEVILPFVGTIVNMTCDLKHNPVLKVFTIYVELVSSLLSDNRSKSWTSTILGELEQKIILFKDTAVGTLSGYSTSGFWTLKFDLLDHLVDDLRRMKGFRFLDAGSTNNRTLCSRGFMQPPQKGKIPLCRRQLNSSVKSRHWILGDAKKPVGEERVLCHQNSQRRNGMHVAIKNDGCCFPRNGFFFVFTQ